MAIGQPQLMTQANHLHRYCTIGDLASGSESDTVMPFTVGDELSSTYVIPRKKMDEISDRKSSKVTDSPVDEKSTELDSRIFIRRCPVNETNVLVDEQSAGAGTKTGNPVDEQSAGLTEEQHSPDTETLFKWIQDIQCMPGSL